MAGVSVNNHRWRVVRLPFGEVGPGNCKGFKLLNKVHKLEPRAE